MKHELNQQYTNDRLNVKLFLHLFINVTLSKQFYGTSSPLLSSSKQVAQTHLFLAGKSFQEQLSFLRQTNQKYHLDIDFKQMDILYSKSQETLHKKLLFLRQFLCRKLVGEV